jgi:predicted alpha/beta-fold hydrolase
MAKVGKETFIAAASVVCTCSDLKLCIDELERPKNWFYRQWVVDQLINLNIQHSHILQDHFKKELNIDLTQTVKSLKWNPSLKKFDEAIQCPYWKYKNTD